MKKYFTVIPILIVMILFSLPLTLCSCAGKAAAKECERPKNNSIYYWRTTFTLNDVERDFVNKHDIKKIYLRYFDVELNTREGNEIVVPSATIKFIDKVPENIEIVPVVYITNDAMVRMQPDVSVYAEKLLRRITAMSKSQGIDFREIQLDCDWTKNSRDIFFAICSAMKQSMDSTQILSSTIRLHQLIQTPPPVDRGVLMVYNTGNLMKMTAENSIFSKKDIKPYLADNRLANYSLPLDVAYPAYGWSVSYRPVPSGYIFDRLFRKTDFSGYPQLSRISRNMYEALENVQFEEKEYDFPDVWSGYRIKVERPTAGEILEVKEMIESQLKEKSHSNILYHLDETQLSHYTDHEIDEIYSCCR